MSRSLNTPNAQCVSCSTDVGQVIHISNYRKSPSEKSAEDREITGALDGGGGGGVPISHVDLKKRSCRPVEFKKCSCHPVDFKN